VNLLDKRLGDPLHLKRPRVIAVNLMGDLFHPAVPFGFIDRVLVAMVQAYWHTYMVLTKRPERVVEFLKVANYGIQRNVWIGTTAGTQTSADERWPSMAWLAAQGWKTWVSSEPRLEAISWYGWSFLKRMVTGGESGPYARPMSPAWPRADRDWCQANGVAFWFKQWGEWGPASPPTPLQIKNRSGEGGECNESNYPMATFGEEMVFQFGRKLAGRVLDGRTWEEEEIK